jgi:hypothetical protein
LILARPREAVGKSDDDDAGYGDAPRHDRLRHRRGAGRHHLHGHRRGHGPAGVRIILTDVAVGGASLTGADEATDPGPFANTSSGLLSVTYAATVATTGTVSSAGAVTASGQTVSRGGTRKAR